MTKPTKIQATPRPWNEQHGDIWSGEKEFPGVPLFNQARGYRSWGRKIEYPEHAANAALIVVAVNSHERLVKALESAREDFKRLLVAEEREAAAAYDANDLMGLEDAVDRKELFRKNIESIDAALQSVNGGR